MSDIILGRNPSENPLQNRFDTPIKLEFDWEGIEEQIGKLQNALASLEINVELVQQSNFLTDMVDFGASIDGVLSLKDRIFDKSANKEIDELNKLCKNSNASLGEYRKALEILDGALKAVGDSAFKAQGHTKNLNKKFKEVGKALGEGINAGVKDTFNSLEKTMVDLGKTMEDAFKDKEKIQSPSKVFKKYGEYITEGLIDGIREGSDDVTDMMRDLGDDMESSFGDKALSFGGGFALAAGVLGTIVEMFSNLMSTNEEFGAAVDEVWTQITEASE